RKRRGASCAIDRKRNGCSRIIEAGARMEPSSTSADDNAAGRRWRPGKSHARGKVRPIRIHQAFLYKRHIRQTVLGQRVAGFHETTDRRAIARRAISQRVQGGHPPPPPVTRPTPPVPRRRADRVHTAARDLKSAGVRLSNRPEQRSCNPPPANSD